MHDHVPAVRHPASRPAPAAAARPPRREPAPVSAAQVATGLVTVFVVCMAVQTAHTVEHGLRLLHWVADPAAISTTPWAGWAADALAGAFAAGDRMAGMELLHLTGSVIFQVGIVAGLAIARRRLLDARRLHQAALVQGLHLLEHAALTVTVLTGGAAVGVSSLFGRLEPMSPAWIAVRVLFHVTVNLVAVWLAVAGAPRPLRHPLTHGRHERSRTGSWVAPPLSRPATAASPTLEPVRLRPAPSAVGGRQVAMAAPRFRDHATIAGSG